MSEAADPVPEHPDAKVLKSFRFRPPVKALSVSTDTGVSSGISGGFRDDDELKGLAPECGQDSFAVELKV